MLASSAARTDVQSWVTVVLRTVAVAPMAFFRPIAIELSVALVAVNVFATPPIVTV